MSSILLQYVLSYGSKWFQMASKKVFLPIKPTKTTKTQKVVGSLGLIAVHLEKHGGLGSFPFESSNNKQRFHKPSNKTSPQTKFQKHRHKVQRNKKYENKQKNRTHKTELNHQKTNKKTNNKKKKRPASLISTFRPLTSQGCSGAIGTAETPGFVP